MSDITEQIQLVVSNKLRPWQYVAKDIIAAIDAAQTVSASALDSAVDTLTESITTVDGKVDTLAERVTAVEGRATAVEGRVTDVEGRVTAVEGRVTEAEGDIDDLEEAISSINSTLASTTTYGLTKITDSTSTTEIEAGMAASPKAVYDALQAAYSYADAAVASGIAGAYKYKGSVDTFSDLAAIQSPSQGDIYNVKYTVNGEEDGVNYAWVPATEVEGQQVPGHWDSLGGILQVENTITASNVSSASPASVGAVVAYVSDQIAAVNTDIQSVSTALGTLAGRVTEAEGDIDDLETALNAETTGVLARLTAVEGRVTEAEGDIDTLEGKVTTLEGKVSTIEGQIDNDSTETPGILQRLDGHDDDIESIETRLGALETGAPTEVTPTSSSDGGSVTVTKASDAVQVINTNGAFSLAFTAAGANDYAVKEILLHAQTNTTLTVTGAVFADAEQDPVWGVAGYELYLRATFINGEVILQVLSNSQEAYNANQYTSSVSAS
jgi:predicted  nucleic acid-binding Zn-ribbon protein